MGKNNDIESFIKLIRTGKKITPYFDRSLEDKRITLTQWEVVAKLLERDGIKQNELVRSININKGSLVKLIDLLERDGWVTRTEDKNDKRAKNIKLTSWGRRNADEVTSILSEVANKMSAGISSKELKTISKALDQMMANTSKANL